MGLIYFLIGLLATTFGALAGLGGGIIIKPVLDALGHYDVASISVLSAATVFTMAAVSLLQNVKQDTKIEWRTSLLLAVGSVSGGLIGKSSFHLLLDRVPVVEQITVIQSTMIAGLMVMIYMFVKKKRSLPSFQMRSATVIVFIGLCLGVLAAFIGIGGGPFNVAVLALLFSMRAKEAALNSIFIIFFSQLTALLYTAGTTGFSELDLSMLWFMLAGGALGGWFGGRISKYVRDAHVERIFNVGIVLMIFLSIFNIVRYYLFA